MQPRREDIDSYLKSLDREMDLYDGITRCDTAFWGGGTPGLLSPRDLERLGRGQLEHFGLPRDEWTVELAPGSVSNDRLAVLRDLGVTRISMGIQSLSPRLLEALGRQHSLSQILRAWDLINAAGFKSRGLDLIFAIPGQTPEDWSADVAAGVALAPDHISTYCLTFEEDTALYIRLSEGKIGIDPERERGFYERAWDQLAAAGFAQYEISNHAQPGHASQHNVNTWRMQEWVGLGPSAASQWGGVRGSNVADLEAWMKNVAAGKRATEDRLLLTSSQLAEDALIFGLRMNAGVNLHALAQRFGDQSVAHFVPVIRQLVGDELAVWLDRECRGVALTRKGQLVADAIGGELLGVAGEAED